MVKTFELNAQVRTDLGKAAARRVRRLHDKIPAVVYGANKTVQTILLDHKKVMHALENTAFYSHILTINVDGTCEKTILRAIQRHPVRPRILHMDFQRVSATEKLTMNTPLSFKGEDIAPGIKAGGVISHLQNTVEITCLPADLPESIEVDVSRLELGGTIHLSHLTIPTGVELVELAHNNDLPIVSIHLPRIVVEETPTPAEAAPTEVPTVGETEKGTDKGET